MEPKQLSPETLAEIQERLERYAADPPTDYTTEAYIADYDTPALLQHIAWLTQRLVESVDPTGGREDPEPGE